MSTKTSEKKKPVSIPPRYEKEPTSMPTRKKYWKMGLFVLGLFVVVLFSVNKGWVVAAMVNGRPIFSWDLNNTLRERYGQQTLEGLIGEQLIADESRKQGVVVTDEEVETKQEEVLSSLGENVNLDEFLQFQGLTKDDFQHQLRVQLLVERLLTKDLAITDADIDAYIASNAALLTATEPAEMKNEAREAIVNNAVSEKLQSWFSELRQTASVMKFIN